MGNRTPAQEEDIVTEVTIYRAVDRWEGNEEHDTVRPKDAPPFPENFQKTHPHVKSLRVDAAPGCAEALHYQELTTRICDFECPDRWGDKYNENDTQMRYNIPLKRHERVYAETHVFDPPFRARYVSLAVLDTWDVDELRLNNWTKTAFFLTQSFGEEAWQHLRRGSPLPVGLQAV